MNSRYPFQKAEKIVLTGSSAGGMATFIWADYVKAMVGANTQFYSIPDSGIFLNPAEPLFPRKRSTNDPQASDAVQVLLSLANKDEGVPNSKCGAALGK
jgi:dienelactone hydrolase